MRHLTPFRTTNLSNSMFKDFDDVFEGFFDGLPSSKFSFQPLADIEEHKSHFLISFDLPGMKEEDINIEVKGDQLTISGERKYENRSEVDDHFSRYERAYGSFMRSFTLPNSLSTEEVEANYDNGVLHVLIPKQQIENKKTINVKTENQDGFLGKLLK